MNLIIFEPSELASPLARNDRRAKHLIEVLRRNIGDSFDAGVLNSVRGKGRITSISETHVTIEFDWGRVPPTPSPINLVIGLPRPQTARDILRDTTTIGVNSIDFVLTEKGDGNYLNSSLWTTGEWRRHLILGAEQAFCTHVPAVTWGTELREALQRLPATGTRVAMDNYEAPAPLSTLHGLQMPVTIALGPERGWSSQDRAVLRSAGFIMAHLGQRVLRTETACIAAVTLVRAALGAV